LRNASVQLALAVCLQVGWAVQAADTDVRQEIEKLKQEVMQLRKDKAQAKPAVGGMVDKAVENKYGPNAPVTSKQGKLTVGGLVQAWFYSIQNDNLGFFGNRGAFSDSLANPAGDTNEGKDNDSFAMRRVELRFTMDIHENVTAVVMLDAAAGAFTNRPSFPTNLGLSCRFPTLSAAEVGQPPLATSRLQDAYINYHGVVPHHDFQIGQFKPMIGLEGPKDNATLDFAERSMIGQLADARDVGIQAHGTWWDDRFQYWLGGYNTPTSFLDPNNQNRADNNDTKSFAYSLLIRPVWKDETWGSLELGQSSQYNWTGEAGGDDNSSGPAVDGLNLFGTNEIRHYAWATYAPGGPVKGWWLKGEYAWIRGRVASAVWDVLPQAYVIDEGVDPQFMPHAFDTSGWYISTGYKIADSVFADKVPCWFKPFEFCFRYETYGNIQVSDLSPSQVLPGFSSETRHDVFKTSVYTAGVNYYIKGHNAKIQLNYNWVREPADDHDGGTPPRQIREVRNDNLILNCQVAW
jgi:hypothetical protein